MELKGYEKFLELRKWFMEKLKKMDDEGDLEYCKSYEGSFELALVYPNFFESEAPYEEKPYVCITLHCYVIGPHRHYDWKGNTIEDAVSKARSDIEKWVDLWVT